jgi:hypothetical protein
MLECDVCGRSCDELLALEFTTEVRSRRGRRLRRRSRRYGFVCSPCASSFEGLVSEPAPGRPRRVP